MTSGIHVRATVILLCAAAAVSQGEVTHSLGLSGGFPQMLALTYQAELSDIFAMEAYAGGLAFFNTTAGFRAILGSTGTGLKPRCFAGYALVHQRYADYPDDPRGTEIYPWAGAGIAVEFESGFQLFGDVVYIGDGDRDRGLGYSTGLSFSGGLMIRI